MRRADRPIPEVLFGRWLPGRSMIRWEATIIAVLGALLGLAVGTFFGWTLVRSLQDQG